MHPFAHHTTPVTLVYAHNAMPTLPALLRLLPPHAPDSPLLVVDDASDDASVALLRELAQAGHIELLRLEGPPHRSRAVNRGIAYALNQWGARDILRVHADILPEPVADLNGTEADRPMFGAYVRARLAQMGDGATPCGVLGVRLVTPDGHVWEQGRRIVCGLGLHAPDRYLLRLTPDAPLPSDTPAREVDGVSGACVLYSHALLVALQDAGQNTSQDAALPSFLDEGYGPLVHDNGLADEDLCHTARVMGFGVCVLPGVRAVHTGAFTPPEGADVPDLLQRLGREKQLLEAQAEYWKHKWGWDPLLPDMGEIRRLYGTSPTSTVCWATGNALRYPAFDHAKNDPPAVDLCIATWNGARVLPRCLASLAATDYPAHKLTLYIIDNASTDDTPEILRRFAESAPFAVRVERLPVNAGAVVALNWAFSRGTAPLVAKLDDDIVVPPDWLQNLAAVFSRRPYAGVVGPCIVDDSPARLVQCADFSYLPTPSGHELEPQNAPWPGLARVSHVRGCCNVYRRDVFARCGLLDIGYSPSQWDDPDHHMALLHEGYEIICAGNVRVAHKCTHRHRPTVSSLTTGAMHKAKMLAKWGTEAPEWLENSLLLSREGRFLPLNDADTGADTGANADAPPAPPAERRPCPGSAALHAHMDARVRQILENSGGLSVVIPGLSRQLRCNATQSLAEGLPQRALGELRTALACGAEDADYPETLRSLADVLELLGTDSTQLRARAAWFSPELPRRAALRCAEPAFPPSFGDADHDCAHATDRPADCATNRAAFRVAFCVPHAHRYDAALRALLDGYAALLRRHGITVTLHAGPHPVPHAHAVHLWTLDHPHETLHHLNLLHQSAPGSGRPIILSPLWSDPAARASVSALARQVRAGLTAESVIPPAQTQEGDAPLLRRLVLERVRVLPLSRWECDALGLPQAPDAGTLPVPLPVNFPATALPAAPEPFRQAAGLCEYVLAVAPFHPAENQAVLLAALKEAAPNRPVVLVGAAREPWYLHACRRLAPQALFVDEMDDSLFYSAVAGAACVALPSLAPCWTTLNTAALAHALNRPLVASPPTAWAVEKTAPTPGVFPCNPLSVPSVAAALRRALAQPGIPATTVKAAPSPAEITALLSAYGYTG